MSRPSENTAVLTYYCLAATPSPNVFIRNCIKLLKNKVANRIIQRFDLFAPVVIRIIADLAMGLTDGRDEMEPSKLH